ncbi:703_t:CDS:2, partial [Ambispora gerdemannii]
TVISIFTPFEASAFFNSYKGLVMDGPQNTAITIRASYYFNTKRKIPYLEEVLAINVVNDNEIVITAKLQTLKMPGTIVVDHLPKTIN